MIIHYYFINNYWLFQTSMDDLDTDEYIRRIQALNAIKDRWWQRLWIRIQQLCGSLFRIRIRIRTVKNRGKRLDWRTKIHNLNWKLSSCVIIFVNFIYKKRNWRKENIIIFFSSKLAMCEKARIRIKIGANFRIQIQWFWIRSAGWDSSLNKSHSTVFGLNNCTKKCVGGKKQVQYKFRAMIWIWAHKFLQLPRF